MSTPPQTRIRDRILDATEVEGEVVTEMTKAEALDITNRINGHLEAMWPLIEQAYTRHAWLALGYQNWDDYCDREFRTTRLRLPREERQAVVCSLRDAGLPIRAIMSATGLGYGTVQREIKTGDPNGSPVTVTGTDGKSYPAQPKPKPKPDVPTPKPKPKPPVDESALNWDSIPGTQREKVRAAVSREVERIRKKLEKERDDAIKAARAKFFADTIAITRESADRLKQDREALNKGIWTPSEYTAILSCLHPDSRASVSEAKLKRAFEAFNDERIKALMVKKTSP